MFIVMLSAPGADFLFSLSSAMLTSPRVSGALRAEELASRILGLGLACRDWRKLVAVSFLVRTKSIGWFSLLVTWENSRANALALSKLLLSGLLSSTSGIFALVLSPDIDLIAFQTDPVCKSLDSVET